MRTGLPSDVCALNNALSVAFDAHTNTLLIAVDNFEATNECCWLVSLRQNASEWVEVQRLCTDIVPNNLIGIVASDSRVLLGERETFKLYAFDVSANHSIRVVGTVVTKETYRAFAATRVGADTLVAFSHDDNSVSLHRLLDPQLRLEPLARSDFYHAADQLQFCGELQLLVSMNRLPYKTRIDGNLISEIVALNTSGGQLTSRQVLLEWTANVYVGHWCVAGNQLVICDRNSNNDLLVYDFEWAEFARFIKTNQLFNDSFWVDANAFFVSKINLYHNTVNIQRSNG